MIDTEYYKKVVEDTSLKLGIPKYVIEEAFKSQWAFVRETLGKIDFLQVEDSQSFSNIRSSFSIPRFGKIHTSLPKVLNINKSIRDKYERK